MDQSNSMSLKVLVIVLALCLIGGISNGELIIQLVTGGSPNTARLAKLIIR